MSNKRLRPEQVEQIIVAYEQGETCEALAQQYGVSHVAISQHVKAINDRRRANKQLLAGISNPLAEQAEQKWIHRLRTRYKGITKKQWVPLIEFLNALEVGMPRVAACQYMGWTDELATYMAAFPNLEIILLQAEQTFHYNALSGLSKASKHDYKAAMTALERTRKTRDEYKPEKTETIVKVEMSYQRGGGGDDLPPILIESIVTPVLEKK